MARWYGKLGASLRQEAKDSTVVVTEGLGEGIADVSRGAWTLMKNRNKAVGIATTYGVAGAYSVAAYQQGYHEADLGMKLQNTTTDPSAGGTFLRNNFMPKNVNLEDVPAFRGNVQDHGATGDLVFALHNLRNGG